MVNILEKVKPRINYFDYNKYHYYIYVYLDPFEQKYSSYKVQGQLIEFAFRPVYIGKATNQGFRHNQHIAEYLKNGQESNGHQVIHNQLKKEYFQLIERNMKLLGHTNVMLPRNWEEYQRDWVIILKALPDSNSLAVYEKRLISTIGTIRKGTGPLVNALLG